MKHRSPDSITPADVCPHCKKPTDRYRWMMPDGNLREGHHCKDCGNVTPMRSAVINEPDWSAA